MAMELEEKIYTIICEPLDALHYDIVRVAFIDGSPHTLQIMIERQDGEQITLDDCTTVSHHVSALLDVEDPISSEYNLEVSSAGLDRPLVRQKDFERFIGHPVKLVTTQPLDNGRRRYSGVLESFIDDVVTLQVENEEAPVTIPFALIEKTNLIPDETIFNIE